MTQETPPFRLGIWKFMLIVYLIGAFAFMFYLADGDSDAKLPKTTIFLFVPPFALIGFVSLRTGVAPSRFDGGVSRTQEPVKYWALVIAYFIAALGCFIMGLGAMLGIGL